MLNISPSIDVAVQACAGIACPVWAPIKFVLLVSQENSTATENILEEIQIIADNLPRLDLYTQFHEDHRFQVALINVFTDITEFSVYAYCFFTKRSAFTLGVFARRTFKEEFGSIISSIDKRTRVVDDTAVALHQQQMERHMRDSKIRAQRENRTRVNQWLGASNMRECHDRHFASMADNTCEWVVSHPSYREWISQAHASRKSPFLIIHGRAGCGKSVLGSYIYGMIDNAHEKQRNTKPTIARKVAKELSLSFSFSSTDATRQTLASLARTFLSQLLERDQECLTLPFVSTLMEKSSVSTNDLFDILSQAIEATSRPLAAVIDGIDECSDPREELFTRLLALSGRCTQLKLVLLGQSYSFTKFLTSSPETPVIAIVPELNRGDIEIVIQTEVERSASLWDTSIRDEVSRLLRSKANGMFLWVRLMLEYFKTASCETELRHCLEDLPDRLEQTYSLLVARMTTRLRKHQQELVHRILSIITTCGRSLKWQELQSAYALSVEPETNNDLAKTETFMLRLPPEDIVELCGGFITFADELFQIVHNSAREFLTGSLHHCIPDESLQWGVFKVDQTESHRTLGKVCLKVFQSIDALPSLQSLETPYDIPKVLAPLVSYACIYGLYHLENSGGDISHVQESCLQLFRSPQFPHFLDQFSSQETEALDLKYLVENLTLCIQGLRGSLSSLNTFFRTLDG